jgi:class 3 adenylate cyclase/tetratricopeptide (TPR) repeat protein
MTCPACGAQAPATARFCPECGQRLVAAPDERRFVTVVMADLVGFTTLSEAADPEQVKRMIDRCFERLVADITAFGGRLDKIVGDEIVALFGAPVAHEDDAERAVRAALRMQESLLLVSDDLGTDIRMRVGVNTGEVVVGALSTGGDTTVMGDAVNTAQRLQVLAAPGEVVVGPLTYAATRAAVDYEPLGAQSVKGRDASVEAYRALTARERPGRRRAYGLAPLVGRELEMATLRGVLDAAVRHRRAQLVVLVGDAGVGKHRLATELGDIARREHGACALTGQALPYGDSNPFGPVAEALRHELGVDGLMSRADARAVIVGSLRAALAPHSPAELDRLVEGLVQFTDGAANPGVDPARARDEAIRAAVAYLEARARLNPVVLTLADVHWAEVAVLEVVTRLLDRLHRLPVVVVVTMRRGTHEPKVELAGRYGVLVAAIEPLDRNATVQLVQTLAEGCASNEAVATLWERSGGNPLFVEELVAYVRESGGRLDGDSLDVRRELPATLHGLVAARIDALTAAERSVLEDCAVIGSSGPVAAVAALAGRDDTRRLVEQLATRDLVVVDRDEFHFKSELIREVAYGTLSKAERARRHATLAPWLATRGDVLLDQVAHHLATAAELVAEVGAVPGVPADVQEQAFAALERAADRAELQDSWLVAGRHHDRALGLVADTDPRRWPALVGRARSLLAQRHLDHALDDALVALEEARDAGDTRTEAAALTVVGQVHAARNDHDAAEATFGEAVDLWRRLGDVSGVANALRALGLSHMFRGETTEAERLFSDALASFRSVGDRRGEAWALQNLAWISFNRGNTGESEVRLQQSADLFGELGDWGGLGWAFGLLAYVRYIQGRLDEAAELAEQMIEEGREAGNRWAVGMMNQLLGNIELWRGRAEEAVRRGDEARSLFAEIGDRWGESMALAPMVRALAELGRAREYRIAMDRLHEVARDLPDVGVRRAPYVIEACVALEYGDPVRAEQLLSDLPPDDDDLARPDFEAAVGLMHLQSGRVEEARAVLEKAYLDAKDDGPRLATGARLALTYAAAHRPEDAARVVAELRECTGGTYNDRMLMLWAEGLARHQRGDDARAPVDAAHAIAATTDSPLQQAIAALVRAEVFAALGDPEAPVAQADAHRRLEALGTPATGWANLLAAALTRA